MKHGDSDGTAEFDLSGSVGRLVAGIGHRQMERTVAILEGKDRRLTQEAVCETCDQRLRAQQLRQRGRAEAVMGRDLIREIVR